LKGISSEIGAIAEGFRVSARESDLIRKNLKLEDKLRKEGRNNKMLNQALIRE